MKLPRFFHFPWRSASPRRPPAVLCSEGFPVAPASAWWTQNVVVIARGRCRLRWFRLAGVPVSERLAALRLQVEAWRPFASADARLLISGEDGLAVAWDAIAVREQLAAAGLAAERFHCMPELLMQPPGEDGVRLLSGAEGFEAQYWKDGFLRSSRWWADALTPHDWLEFVHASGAGREADVAQPALQPLLPESTALIRSHPLHASSDHAVASERRVVLAGAVGLSLAAGMLGHQTWDAYRQSRQLVQQIAEAKSAVRPVLAARDSAVAAANDAAQLAAWFARPLPVDVIGYLSDGLAKSGVLLKELELEGDKLRVGLQLGANATRAGIVKDLQAGGWLTDVAEVRADNSRGLLTMEMHISGLRPPVGGSAGAVGGTAAVEVPQPTVTSAAPAVAPPTPAAPAKPVAAPAVALATAPGPAPARPPGQAPKPIVAKPDANGMPPADVFNAIPNR